MKKASAYCSTNSAGRRGAIVFRRTRRHMGHTVRVQDAFWYVLLGVVIFGGLAAVVAFAFTGRAYEQIGKGGFFKDTDGPQMPAGGAVSDAERDDEIRQMLTARNARHAANGREVVDVEAELARLTRTTTNIDPALREEIRQLVVAKNARRVRKGLEPLDVEAEVERQVTELGG